MHYDGNKCPICHGKKKVNPIPIVSGLIVIGVVMFSGIFIYTNDIQFDQVSFDNAISVPESLSDEFLEEFPNEIPSIPSDISQLDEIQNKIKETSDEIVQKIEEEQKRLEEEQKIADAKYIQEITVKIHDLVNEQRLSHGLNQLSWNDKLGEAALNHSNDMASRDYFDHDSPEGHDFSWRYSQVGYSCSVYRGNMIYGGGENIMYLDGYVGVDTIASQTVDGWMSSPGHRDNILTSYFQNQGIGVAVSFNEVYVTQNFC